MKPRIAVIVLTTAFSAAAAMAQQEPPSMPANARPGTSFVVGDGEHAFDSSTIKSGWLVVHFLPTLDSDASRTIVRDHLRDAPMLAGVRHIFITQDSPEAFATGLKAINSSVAAPVYRDRERTVAAKLHVDLAGTPHALVVLTASGSELWRHSEQSPSEHLSFAAFAQRLGDLTRDRAASEANLPSDHLALAGYDPVAYLDEHAATPGEKSIESSYRGVLYRFASAAHRDAFNADPERYLPAYGGWCATAMAKDKKVEVDPKNFKIAGGRILLFYKGLFGNALDDWNKDETGLARKADTAWAKLVGAGPSKPNQ